jgi:hypothetical protein
MFALPLSARNSEAPEGTTYYGAVAAEDCAASRGAARPRRAGTIQHRTIRMNDDESRDNNTSSPEEAQATDADVPAKWTKGGPSPNPKGRPKQPKTVKEVRELARQHTVQMVEVLARVANNPKSPPAARQAAASSLLDRAWGKPASLDLEGAEQLVIRVVKFGEQSEEIKTIEGKVIDSPPNDGDA